DTPFTAHVVARATASDTMEGGFVGGARQRRLCGDDGLLLLGRPLVPEDLRHPRGGGIPVGPAVGRSSGIPCCAGGGGGHLLLVGGEFVVGVVHESVLRGAFVVGR